MKKDFAFEALQAIVFFISAFLFVWPFLASSCVARPWYTFLYLFTVWAVLIFLAFLTSRKAVKMHFMNDEEKKGRD